MKTYIITQFLWLVLINAAFGQNKGKLFLQMNTLIISKISNSKPLAQK